jgi:hypothetical protein
MAIVMPVSNYNLFPMPILFIGGYNSGTNHRPNGSTKDRHPHILVTDASSLSCRGTHRQSNGSQSGGYPSRTHNQIPFLFIAFSKRKRTKSEIPSKKF